MKHECLPPERTGDDLVAQTVLKIASDLLHSVAAIEQPKLRIIRNRRNGQESGSTAEPAACPFGCRGTWREILEGGRKRLVGNLRTNPPNKFARIGQSIKLLTRADAADHGAAEPRPVQVGNDPNGVFGDQASDLDQSFRPGPMLSPAHQIVQQPVGQRTGERLRADPLHHTEQAVRNRPEHRLDNVPRLAHDKGAPNLGQRVEGGQTVGRRDLFEIGGQLVGSGKPEVGQRGEDHLPLAVTGVENVVEQARALRVDVAGRLERPCRTEGARLESCAVREGGLEFVGQHLIRTATVR